MADDDNNKLSERQRVAFDNYYKKDRDKLPVCPTCQTNNDVIPTVRGRPTSQLMAYADEGNVKLSGCTRSYNGWCKKCQKFL